MRVAVLAGGRSSEHDVSLQSAGSVGDGLREAGHEVVWVELARDGTWRCDGVEIPVTPGRGLLECDAVFSAPSTSPADPTRTIPTDEPSRAGFTQHGSPNASMREAAPSSTPSSTAT